jgi:hypothetical protein
LVIINLIAKTGQTEGIFGGEARAELKHPERLPKIFIAISFSYIGEGKTLQK